MTKRLYPLSVEPPVYGYSQSPVLTVLLSIQLVFPRWLHPLIYPERALFNYPQSLDNTLDAMFGLPLSSF